MCFCVYGLAFISLSVYKRADGLTLEHLVQVAGGIHVEDDDVEAVLLAEREGGHVHDLEVARVYLVEGYGVEFLGRRVLLGVSRVDAVNARAFEQNVSMPRSAEAESVVK